LKPEDGSSVIYFYLLNTQFSILFTMDFDSEFWIYIAFIVIAVVYFLWNKSRIDRDKTARKNKNFREGYEERKNKS